MCSIHLNWIIENLAGRNWSQPTDITNLFDSARWVWEIKGQWGKVGTMLKNLPKSKEKEDKAVNFMEEFIIQKKNAT